MNAITSTLMPRCLLLATGGTIAMKLDPVTQVPVPALSGEDLLAAIPRLPDVARVQVRNLSNLPSTCMDAPRWAALHAEVVAALADPDIAGVVVSHGTDTLEETAWFLDLTVNSDKPVVLVGAQRHASDPDFDGPRNLLHAVRVCVSPAARQQGVLAVLNNQINAARDVSKTHTSDVEAFKSGDSGFLGRVDDDAVIFSRTPNRRQHLPLADRALARVDIVAMYAGADGGLARAAVQLGAGGLVIEALGCGNVNDAMHEAVCDALRAGVAVVISTRVPQGRVRPVYGFPGGGRTLKDAGAVFADDLSPQKARILLMLALQTSWTTQSLQRLFDR